MPVTWYATAEQADGIIKQLDPQGMAGGADTVTQDEVEVACHDIDTYTTLAYQPARNGDTLRLLPSVLDSAQQTRLARAVALQIMYRRRMGAGFFIDDQYASASGNGISRSGRLEALSPAAHAELRGLVPPRMGTFGSRRAPSPWRTVGRDPLFPWLGK